MRKARPRPKRLPEKLRQIRLTLGLSQAEMVRRLGLEEGMQYARISEYEQGIREPSLLVLLRYARVAGVYVEEIIDDKLDLPAKLPSKTTYCRRLS
jgi:transcriptional regulator with XRE-family HTH domain